MHSFNFLVRIYLLSIIFYTLRFVSWIKNVSKMLVLHVNCFEVYCNRDASITYVFSNVHMHVRVSVHVMETSNDHED